MLRLPVIIVNCKAYPTATGQKAVELANVCARVAEETGKEIAIAVSSCDIHRVATQVEIPVLAQHVDGVEPGSHTGSVIAEAVREAGADGTLLNHSERRIPKEDIESAIQRCNSQNLSTIVCAQDPDEAKELSLLKPTMIAMEPPELIGGDVSVSTQDPESIKKSAQLMHHEGACGILIVGAGIKDGNDVRVSRELGAQGVLVASGITKADDPYTALKELVSGLM